LDSTAIYISRQCAGSLKNNLLSDLGLIPVFVELRDVLFHGARD